jgi:BolA family transcriptional regulator, general stress-responsive regulator
MTDFVPVRLPIRDSDIERQLLERLQPTRLEVIDESAAHAGHTGANEQGFGTHFRIRIASPAFAGLNRVQRHRLVYDALQNFIASGLHAVAIEVTDSP